MKCMVLAAWGLGALLFGPWANPQDKTGPIMTLDVERYNFGEILSGEKIVRTLVITNRGDEDLIIKRFEFSCGCTIPRMELSTGELVNMKDYKYEGRNTLTLKPGVWAKTQLEFISIGRLGPVTYKMVIHSNFNARPKYHIPIVAKVKPAFDLKPKVLKFGTFDKSSKSKKSFTITSKATGLFEIKGVKNLPDYITMTWERIMSSISCAYEVEITVHGKGPAGKHNMALQIEVDSKRSKCVAIPISYTILSDISFMFKGKAQDNAFNVGLFDKNKQHAYCVRIINKNPDIPYQVTKMTTAGIDKNQVLFDLKTVRPGLEYELIITIKPNFSKLLLKGEVKLFSKHPEMKLKKFFIRGKPR